MSPRASTSSICLVITEMHWRARLGTMSFSSKLTIFRLSSGFRFCFGAAGFLKGSIPAALVQLWQRCPGGGDAG